MAVTYVGAGAAVSNATTASQVYSCHANTAIGDILICQMINKSVTANAFSPPDGTWTAIITTEVNDCTTAADDHQYGLYWKRATAAGVQNFTFTKAVDDNVLWFGVMSSWRGALASGSPIDATAPARTETAGAADNVSFPAFDPTLACHVIYMAYYGNDLTTFAAAMSGDTNPDCTTRYDFESGTGNDASIACTSGDSDGSAIASRTWASASTTDAGNTGVVFGLVPQGATIEERDLSSSGAATVTVAGAAVVGKDLASTGAATVTLEAALVLDEALSSSGAAAVTFEGATIEARDLASSGAATVTMEGENIGAQGPTIIERDLVISCGATVAFEAALVLDEALVSTGLGTVTFASAALSGGDLVASGGATVSLASGATHGVDLSSEGSGVFAPQGEDASSPGGGESEESRAKTRSRALYRRPIIREGRHGPALFRPRSKAAIDEEEIFEEVLKGKAK